MRKEEVICPCFVFFPENMSMSRFSQTYVISIRGNEKEIPAHIAVRQLTIDRFHDSTLYGILQRFTFAAFVRRYRGSC